MLPGDGSRHGGPVKRRKKMRAGIGVTPSSTGHWKRGWVSPVGWLERKKKGRFWKCFASFFHLDAVVSSRLPFIVEFSNIINIENLNISIFILWICICWIFVRVSLCASVSEGVWLRGIMWTNLGGGGKWSLKKRRRWCTGRVDGLWFLQKQSETFWFLPSSVFWFVFLSISVTAMKISSVWINVKTKMQCGLHQSLYYKLINLYIRQLLLHILLFTFFWVALHD